MPKGDIYIGLEIGTSKVCAVVAEGMKDGTINILGVGDAPSRGVRKGEIVDFEMAKKSLRDALGDAEDKTDVIVRSLYLAVTGSHIESSNHRVSVEVGEPSSEISESDCVRAEDAARAVPIPTGGSYLHTIVQHYYVDGQDGVLNPVGMSGQKLEADYHVVHGLLTRIKNTLRCVGELDIEVKDVVFSPIASAQVVLDFNQRGIGSLVLDMGGGTTGFVLYKDGVLKHSGVLAIGGDHITNDLANGLRLPGSRADRMKVEYGSVNLEGIRPGEKIVLQDEINFAGRDIDREMFNTIIHCRVREIFELIRDQLLKEGAPLSFLAGGVLLTGGTSKLDGVRELAEEVFGLPVQLTHAVTQSGMTSAFENPHYSTAIGVVKYAMAMQGDEPGGWFSKFKNRLRGTRLWLW